jgi:ferric-dicitrate binding protein FerR (iron transport regulator)
MTSALAAAVQRCLQSWQAALPMHATAVPLLPAAVTAVLTVQLQQKACCRQRRPMARQQAILLLVVLILAALLVSSKVRHLQ